MTWGDVIVCFNKYEYYAENDTTSFINKETFSIWRVFPEHLLFVTIAFDVCGVLTKNGLRFCEGNQYFHLFPYIKIPCEVQNRVVPKKAKEILYMKATG